MAKADITSEVHAPEEVHRVLRVLYARNWIAPMIFGGLILWMAYFLVFDTIAITATGNAMFLTRETVIPFQSVATGQIAKWHVKVGDEVQQGQILAVLEQPVLEKQLAQARQQLADMIERNGVIRSLTESHTRLEKAAIERKRKMLKDRIAVLEQQIAQSKDLAKANRAENLQAIQQQRAHVQQARDLEKQRLQELHDDLQRTEQLRKERLRSADDVVNAKQAYSDQVQRVLDMELQLLQLHLTKIRADESYLQSLNKITEREDALADLHEQLETLVNQETQLDKSRAEAEAALQLQVSELERTIAQLEKELSENREIRSEHTGRILELTAGEGKLVTRGQRLGTIDARRDSSVLEAVAYFKVEDGKRIKPGMKLYLTPATVERQRFGSVIARVTSVSRFAVSAEGAAKVVGNLSVARALTQDGRQIEVFAELLKDAETFSGYQWDLTDGPAIAVTSGTIASALATLEERAPVTFVIPILRY